MSRSITRRPLQIATFARKEITDVLHQPKLLLTLVLGPFLIMAAFGLGYRQSPPPLRTLLVAPAGSPMLNQINTYADQLKSYVTVVGVGTDIEAAGRQLRDGKIDVIVSFPGDPLTNVLNGTQAPITIVHTRLDPIERTAISFASSLAVDQINGAILAHIIAAGQQSVRPLAGIFDATDAAVKELNAASVSGDSAALGNALSTLRASSVELAQSAQKTADLIAQIGSPGTTVDSKQLLSNASDLATTVGQLQRPDGSLDPQAVGHLTQVVDNAKTQFTKFSTVSSAILAAPFTPDVQLAVPGVHRITDWYGPAAVVLILQQFGLAFGALTFVRERQLGITDVLRVAPVNAASALTGKYLAYLIVGTGIGASLTALVIWGLHIPIAGSVAYAAAVLGLTLFASIGLGFIISLISATDAQAVQYALMLLLASLFFSGFFLSIGQMKGPAQAITWLLPVSYGMQMLRDVMLRGTSPQPHILIGLGAYGAVTAAMAYVGTRRRMRTTAG